MIIILLGLETDRFLYESIYKRWINDDRRDVEEKKKMV